MHPENNYTEHYTGFDSPHIPGAKRAAFFPIPGIACYLFVFSLSHKGAI